MEMWFYVLLTVVFWGSSLLIMHTYAFYPVILSFLARNRKLPDDVLETEEELPEVVVLMAVYNEESVIEDTLESMAASNYPKDRMRILIGSDGSTDRSHAIIEEAQKRHSGIELEIFSGRNGKVRIVNRLARKVSEDLSDAENSVFIMCDANVTWKPDMLRNLVRHFKRADVGLVGASVVDMRGGDHEGISAEEDGYVSRENVTKYQEGVLWGATMGAFGACYALRASLFTPVPENYIVDDFFLTMSCLEQGKKAIVDLEAVCNEPVSTEIREEFRRKHRIATGNFQNLQHFGGFLSPWNGGWPIWFAFWSHKGLRWTGPMLLIAAFISCPILALISPIYLIPYSIIVGTWLISGIDYLNARSGKEDYVKLFRYIRYFYSMNGAILLGFFSFCRGVQSSIWEPTKRMDAAGSLTEQPAAVES